MTSIKTRASETAILHRSDVPEGIGVIVHADDALRRCWDQMAQALADYIRASLDRAAEAEQLASREAAPVTKAELQELANGWRKVAADYQYVEKLESFLKAHTSPEGPLSKH